MARSKSTPDAGTDTGISATASKRQKTNGNGKRALTRARDIVRRNQHDVQSKLRQVWSVSRRAPCFAKRGKKGTALGTVRANALVGNHAFRTAAAGSGLVVQKETRSDASLLRVPLVPDTKTPFVPTVSEGAKVMIEQYLAAFVQEGLLNASYIRKARKRTRISHSDTMHGLQTASARMSGADDRAVALFPPRTTRGTKKRKRDAETVDAESSKTA
jgi:hypothetical protein